VTGCGILLMNNAEEKPCPVKILFVHPVNCLGGAEFSLLGLASGLNPEKFDPLVVIPPDGPLTAEFRAKDIPVKHLPFRRLKRSANPFSLLAAWFACRSGAESLRQLIEEEKAELVHANNAVAALYAGIAVKGSGVPMIWHERDLRNRGRIGRYIAKNADKIIAISTAVADNLRHTINHAEKIVTLPNGINSEKFMIDEKSVTARQDLGLPERGPLVLMAGQMVPWKKHALFIRAAAGIKDEFPDHNFVIAGRDYFNDHPDYLASLQKLTVELGLGDRVTFTGFVEDMPSLLFWSQCLVLPATREPFGRVLLEAMAAGKPVIAVDSSGPAEIIEHGKDGLLVAPDDSEAIAKVLRKILAEKEFADKLSAAGQEKVKNKYSVAMMVNNFQEILAQIIDGK